MKLLLSVLFTILSITPAYAQTTVGAIVDGTEVSGQRMLTNYAVNPNFEKKGTIGVTSGGAGTASVFQRTAKQVGFAPIKGNGSLSYSSATVGHTFTFDSNALDPIEYGKQCMVKQYYRGGGTGIAGYKMYVTRNGTKINESETTITIEDVLVPKLYYYSLPCGNSTSGKIRVVHETTLTSVVTMDVDETYIGQDDNIGTVAQAISLGTLLMNGGTGSCVFTKNGTSGGENSWTVLGAGSSCNTSVVTGVITNPNPNNIEITLPPGPSGVYTVRLSAPFFTPSADGICNFRFTDGTRTFGRLTLYTQSGSGISGTLIGTAELPASSTSRRIQVEAAVTLTNSCAVQSDTPGRGFEWSVTYYPTQAQTAIKLNEATGPTVSTVSTSAHTGGFSANGSGTYTPPAGVKYIQVRMVGAGGGGGASSNASCNGSQVGGTGGSTTLGSLLAATGGVGGACGDIIVGGNGGSFTITAPAKGTGVTGQYGGGNNLTNPGGGSLIYVSSGNGGSSPYFGGGAPSVPAGVTGFGGVADTGGGGSGAGLISGNVVTRAGAGGGSGGFIEAMIESPSSMSYAIGTGGGAGSYVGTGFVGGAGANGYIQVTEYYGSNLPILMTTVISPSNGGIKIAAARITNSNGGQAITSQTGSWLTTNGCSSAGQCQYTVTAGTFTAEPACTCSAGLGAANGCAAAVGGVNGPIIIFTKNFSTYVNEGGVSLNCTEVK